MGKIQVYAGRFDETCTVSSNLTENQQKKPVIRDVIQYAEPRMLSTLIVSGAKSPWDLQGMNTRNKIGKIPADKLIGDHAFRYNVLGRIQKKTVIGAQVGTSGLDGSFQLSLKDNYIVQGMIVTFWDGLQARVQGLPAGGPGNFVYSFQTIDKSVFNFAASVTPQSGDKTCFGQFTAYSERSLRGFGRTHYPDQFINHLGIQRKTVALSGSALTDVLWYEYNGAKGWIFEKERQARIQFMMEDEWNKIFGKSTMRDSNNNLLAVSNVIDPETGEQVVIGDGILEQIKGGNEMFGSGIDGSATIDDISDFMRQLEKKSNSVYGKMWYVVTGTDGYGTLQDLFRDYRVNFMGGRTNLNQNAGQTQTIGGEDIPVGGNFDVFNIHGNQIVTVKHPMFDDEERFTQRGSDGKLLQSSMMIFLDMGTVAGRSNIEIMTKGAYGINRSMVSAYLNGVTGDNRDVVSSTDAIEFNMLKEDGIFIYNTMSCGIIYKSPN
jgi:hypothetical protein